MKRTILALPFAFALSVFALGCAGDSTPSSGSEICDNKIDDDGDNAVDCLDSDCAGTAACAGGGDGGPLPDTFVPGTDGGPQPDSAPKADTGTPSASALQAVMNKLLMPKGAGDYGYNFGGSTPKNKLGGIIGAVLTVAPTVDLQTQIDSQINDGSLILLFDVLAKSLQNASPMQIVMTQGTDLDSNAADNFSGSEEFSVSATGPGIIKVNGTIANGRLSADGEVTMAIPLGLTSTVLTLKSGHVEADLSPSGMLNGQVNGAIPMDQVNNALIPGIAQLMNDPTLDPLIKGLFDADKDGTITAVELQTNILIAFLLTPDVDTDGQNGPDALSIGLGFTAVPCKIQPY
jgi:hypothetical protein